MSTDTTLQTVIQLWQAGNLQEAEYLCREILKKQPRNADVLHLSGVISYQMGNLDLAVKCIGESLSLNPSNAEAYFNLGNILKDMNQPDEAIALYQKALHHDPNNSFVYVNLGYCFQAKGNFDEAIMCYKKALQSEPENVTAYYNLGTAYQDKELFDEAIVFFQKALQIDPHHIDAYLNLGVVFQEKEFIEQAIECFRKALQIDPELPIAHWNLSQALLLAGNFEEGWKEYEWRWKVKELYEDSLPQQHHVDKLLCRRSDVAGHTILLSAEQGYGDTIQFVRYATLVAQLGANVIVECQKELASLVATVKGVQKVIEIGQSLPEFNLQSPLLNLPGFFKTTLETIPSDIPYLTVNPHALQHWSDKIGDDQSKLKVGLAWAGGQRHKKNRLRSCSFDLFFPLLLTPDTIFYNLQKEQSKEQFMNLPEGAEFIDYTDAITDFSDTAAFIENLDLIISVDTAVAHVAGALGKAVWVLLPFSPDWRWMLNRKDSPWYPTMRLYRQPSPGDWSSVITAIANELQRIVKNNS